MKRIALIDTGFVRKIIFPVLFCICSLAAFGQSATDSLQKYALSATGVEKAKALFQLAGIYGQHDTAKAFAAAAEAFEISKKVNYKKGLTDYFFIKTRLLAATQGEKPALAFLKGCYVYLDTTTPSKDLATYYITLGGIYNESGKLGQASASYLAALKNCDRIGDTLGIARASHGLGMVQMDAGNIPDAERYFIKAKKYYGLANQKSQEVSMISNLGSLFLTNAMKTKKKEDYKKAYDYLTQGLSASMKIDQYEIVGNNYHNLASLYGSQNELDVCLDYDFKALAVRREHGLKYGIASSLGNIAAVYFMKHRNDLAEKYFLESTKMGEELNSSRLLVSNYEMLSEMYASQKKFDKSLEFYKKSSMLRDSMNNSDKITSMTRLEKQYDTEKKDQQIELLNQAQQVKDAQLARERILNYAVGLGLALVIFFSFFLLRANGMKRKANEKLHLQNQIIEEKNRHITDSINYAKTIQSAIIPNQEEFSGHFSDSFVCYMPKDIVSGDFYWITKADEIVYFAVADCTGHGVPGGFMCMLGSSSLSEIVTERKVSRVSEILDQLRNKIMISLRQTGQSGENKDGMDISLCRFDKQSQKLSYACSYNSFYVIRNGVLTESEINKMPVGYHHKMEPFRESQLELQKGDILYLFTDGYADQFGGEKGKKFKYSRLKELLQSISSLPMSRQKEIVEKTIIDWRGDQEQVDDICLIGIKI